jgi:hypothetical protein
LAVLAALRSDAHRFAVPRADGDREALLVLLGARQDLTVASGLDRLTGTALDQAW